MCNIKNTTNEQVETNFKSYNDVTHYKHTSFIYFFFKIQENTKFHEKSSTHINLYTDEVDFEVEIHTVNINNTEPQLLPTKEFLDIIYKQWIEQLNPSDR